MMIYEFKALNCCYYKWLSTLSIVLPHKVTVFRFLKLVCSLINCVVSIQNPASDNVDESLLADHDDSNICDVPSKHIEDNGKFKNLYFH